MPRITVPVIEEQQVRNAGLPNVRQTARATPQSMGAGIGQGLSKVAKIAGSIAEKEREKADLAQMTEFSMNANMLENALNEEAFQIRGKNAVEVPDEFLKRREDGITKLLEELPEHLKDRARLMTMKSAPAFQKSLLRHSKSELDAYDKAQAKAYLENSAETAALLYNDPERVGLEIQRSDNLLNARAANQGWSVEQLTEAKEGQRAAIHATVIDRAVAEKDWEYASEYFDGNEEDLKKEPSLHLKAKKLVAQAELQGLAAQDVARITSMNLDGSDESVSSVDQPGRVYATLDQYLEETYKIDDLDRRELVQKGVRQWYNDIIKPQREQAYIEAANAIENGASYFDLPADLRASLSSAKRSSLMSFEDKIKKVRGGGSDTDDLVSFSNLHDIKMLATDPANKERVLEYDPVAMYANGQLNKKDSKELSKLQVSLSESKDKDNEKSFELRRTASLNQMINAAVQDTPAEKKKNPRAYAAFHKSVAEKMEEEAEVQGRKLKQSEEQKIIDEEAMRFVFVDDWFGDSRKHVSQLTREDFEDGVYADYDDAPDHVQKNITNFIRSEGGDPSDKDLRDKVYGALLVGDDELLVNSVRQ